MVPPPEADEDDDDDPDHHGRFTRLTLGLGLGHVSGSLRAEPGFKPVDVLSHTAPVVGAALQVGGGAQNFAVAGELLYERMLRQLLEPSKVTFSLIGIGVTASLYLDEDWFVTGHLRWVFMLLYKSEIPCWVDGIDGTSGPGLGVTLGKEWFGRDDDDDGGSDDDDDHDNGLGVALQLNYASLSGDPKLKYVSGLVLLSLTHF
jgi:hypothetical protein